MKARNTLTALSACIASAAVLACSAGALTLTENSGASSMGCISYEVNNEAWAHLINPYNSVALYAPVSESDIADDTCDVIVKFDVTGVETPFTVFPGFMAYGDDAEGEELSIWSQNDYVEATGSEYTFVVDSDGSYELIVPLKAMADECTGCWGEHLESLAILELCLGGAANDDMDGFINSGMTITFTGIEQSPTAHTVAECSNTGAAAANPPAATDSDVSDKTDAADTNTNPETGAAGIGGAAAAAAVAAAAMFLSKKRRS